MMNALSTVLLIHILSGYLFRFHFNWTPHSRISTKTEVAVLKVKKTTKLIPKTLVMRHLLRGTTTNILVKVRNKDIVETSRVGESET
jgi:hypothetical protein